MVDNAVFKCYDANVYRHLIYGTFVDKSTWLKRQNGKLKLSNGKSDDNAHELTIEFGYHDDWMQIYGSIRKWYYGAVSLDDLTKKDLKKAWQKVAARLGISFDSLRTFEISRVEIGQNVPLDMICSEMIHRIRGFRSGCYELNDSRPTCRKYVTKFYNAKCYDKIAEINEKNRNILIKDPEMHRGKNILRIEFTLKGGRRRILARLKVGTLGGLIDEYNSIVNHFWRSCHKFFFDNIGRRPSFRPKRGSMKELTDFFTILGLSTLSSTELDGHIQRLKKEAQRDFRKRLRELQKREREYAKPDYQFELIEAVKWRLVALIQKNARQRDD